MSVALMAEVARADEERASRMERLLADINAKLDRLLSAQPERLGAVDDAAEEVGVSQCTIRRWEKAGIIKSVRRGGRVLIVMNSLRPTSDDEIARLAREARQTIASGER